MSIWFKIKENNLQATQENKACLFHYKKLVISSIQKVSIIVVVFWKVMVVEWIKGDFPYLVMWLMFVLTWLIKLNLKGDVIYFLLWLWQVPAASNFSVLMPGQQYPTYIAQPAPLLPSQREGVYWPSHEHHFVFN